MSYSAVKSIQLKNASPQGKDEASRLHDGIIVAIEENKIEHAFRHSYNVTASEADTLQRYFGAQLVFQDPDVPPKDTSHPILAAINEYCNKDVRKQIIKLKEQNVSVMTIGDSVNKTLGADHNCLLVDSAREGKRIVDAVVLQTTHEQKSYLKFALNKEPTPLCVNGVQKCNFKATHAFAVHSTYDIELGDIYEAFYRHDIIKMVVYMYIPTLFYHPSCADFDTKSFGVRADKSKDTVFFNMHDKSIPYVHSYRMWHNWAHFTSISGNCFRVVREVSRVVGPLQIITLTRVNHSLKGDIWMTVPLKTMSSGFNFVPDLLQYLDNGSCFHQDDLQHFAVPSHVVDGINTYCCRVADEGYKFAEVATLASGLKRQLRIGDQVYYDNWDVDPRTYNRVIISLFLLGAFRRTDRTKAISTIFRQLKDSAGFWGAFSDSVVKPIKRWFLRIGKGDDKFEALPEFQAQVSKLGQFNILTLSDKNTTCDFRVNDTDGRSIAIEIDGIMRFMPEAFINKARGPYANKIYPFGSKPKREKYPFRDEELHDEVEPSAPPADDDGSERNDSQMEDDNAFRYDSNAERGDDLSLGSATDLAQEDDDDGSEAEPPQMDDIAKCEYNIVMLDRQVKTSKSPADVDYAKAQLTFYRKILHDLRKKRQEEEDAKNVKINLVKNDREPKDAGAQVSLDGSILKNLFADGKSPSVSALSIDTMNPPSLSSAPVGFLNALSVDQSPAPASDDGTGDEADVESDDGSALVAKPPAVVVQIPAKDNVDVSSSGEVDDSSALVVKSPASINQEPPKTAQIQQKDVSKTSKEESIFKSIFVKKSKLNADCCEVEMQSVGSAMVVKSPAETSVKIDSKLTPGQNDSEALSTMLKSKDGLLSKMVNSIKNSEPFTGPGLLDKYRKNVSFKNSSKVNIDINGDGDAISMTHFSTSTLPDITLPINQKPINVIKKAKDLPVTCVVNTTKLDPSVINAISRGEIPTKFLVGHCSAQSCYESYYNRPQFLHKKCSIKDYLIRLMQNMADLNKREPEVDEYSITAFIFGGVWQHENVSALALKAFTEMMRTDVVINTKNYIHVVATEDSKDQIEIYHANEHYSSLPYGGAADKFSDLIIKAHAELDLCMPDHFIDDRRPVCMVEMSCAPGNLLKALAQHYRGGEVRFFGFHYVKGIPLNKKLLNDNRIIIYQYSTRAELRSLLHQVATKYSIISIYNDAARAVNSEEVTDYINDIIMDHFKTNDIAPSIGGVYEPMIPRSYICKTFANPVSTWSLSVGFERCDVYSPPTNGEKYYILSGVKMNVFTLPQLEFDALKKEAINVAYKKYNQEITDHTYAVPQRRLREYVRSYFCKGEEFDSRPYGTFFVDNPIRADFEGQIKCLTGYASASKTTKAIAMYPKATFVSPTRELCMVHTKNGVSALTQHQIFSVQDDPNIIVVDECSQFYLEYFALLQLRFPLAQIIALGDIYQTPPLSFGRSCPFTTLKNIGVKNNIWDTYKIPQDIAELLNDRFDFNIIAHSEVQQGLKMAKESDVTKLPKGGYGLKYIAFNSATVKAMKAQGLNASTITTYTGSRHHTVVFYVDAAAISSQITSRAEYIYTAMTRATNQLVLYGDDSKVIQQYFHVNGSNICTLQELNNVRLHNDTRVEPIEVSSDPVEVKVFDEPPVATHVEPKIAVDVIQKEYAPTNASDVFVNYAPPAIPAPQQGSVKVKIDHVMAADVQVRGYKVEPTAVLVKNQLSTSVLQTVQTMITRYTKKNPKIGARKTDILLSELHTGLSRAITGDPSKFEAIKKHLANNSHKLQKHYTDYLIKAQKKNQTGANSKAFKEEFVEFDQIIKFFNKNQCKYKPETGFDTSAKVGQGVANVPKLINILFSCYARYILTELKEFAKICGKKVIFATHDSDEDFNAEFTKMFAEIDPELAATWTCDDFNEWDASFRQVFIALMCSLLEACGCPWHLHSYYYRFRASWDMYYQTMHGTAKVSGKEKQMSGGPFTICENTLMNAALINTIFVIIRALLEIYKGDDSGIYSDSVVLSARGKEILGLTGHTHKVASHTTGEFAGYILTPQGIFPDLVRYAAKFLGKIYRDKDHFKEAIVSLKDRLACVKTQAQKEYGCLALTEHYKMLTSDDMHVLYDFLATATRTDFKSLVPVAMSTMTPVTVWSEKA